MSDPFYKGNTPVKHRDKVELCLDGTNWMQGVVGEALASQFTVVYGKGRSKHMTYLFYSDKGVTWK